MRIIVTDFGAKPDGVSFSTEAIQKAIDTCFENGCGVVVIPAGIYLSRPIRLKSNVTLYLERRRCCNQSNQQY
ncbi:glycosyl hydrolase family 28-related protein [Caldicellulosiruptor naganoensis]|uniref:Rhamnogalacturonase A/B/Epimerase-like pectate lyase domain-containing protein n=1 Tax=Caldicellulosiruptor naganoensis TaxID=29324 RepID=A0ABY7BGJ8_9FIRM|nr:glycosyl hydrolase family 28-related protein [Caldicellulosiruptor naganoensis]WAM31939.1 hypothetical protein OTJ99_000424 [Caldicellulosiruptor naganoensis]